VLSSVATAERATVAALGSILGYLVLWFIVPFFLAAFLDYFNTTPAQTAGLSSLLVSFFDTAAVCFCYETMTPTCIERDETERQRE
jgi:hypothetical protein